MAARLPLGGIGENAERPAHFLNRPVGRAIQIYHSGDLYYFGTVSPSGGPSWFAGAFLEMIHTQLSRADTRCSDFSTAPRYFGCCGEVATHLPSRICSQSGGFNKPPGGVFPPALPHRTPGPNVAGLTSVSRAPVYFLIRRVQN